MDKQEIENQALALRTEAERLEIVDRATYEQANEFGRRIKLAMKTIDNYCDPIIEATNKAHKAAIEQKKALYEPFEAVERVINQKQIAWYKSEQERAKEERRKAEEEARRKAEEDALNKAQELQKHGGGRKNGSAGNHEKIIALAKEGKSPEEISKLLSVGSIKVKNSINYGKKHGDIPYTKPRPAAEVSAQETVSAPAPTPLVSEAPKITVQAPVSTGIPDVAILHEMIDLAARLPKVKAEILHSCDEIEATARYQLSLADEIRKALSA